MSWQKRRICSSTARTCGIDGAWGGLGAACIAGAAPFDELDRVVQASYDLLGLISFFTVGEDECRAWTVPAGSRAVEAAGAIHSDLQKGFIRAEVVAYADLVALGGLNEARGKGKLRLEGKEYVLQDGEIMHVRFNV